MPLEIKGIENVYRCIVCGKLTSNPIFYKTCCMNKAAIFCSQQCAQKWISQWIKNQEQIIRKSPQSIRFSKHLM